MPKELMRTRESIEQDLADASRTSTDSIERQLIAEILLDIRELLRRW